MAEKKIISLGLNCEVSFQIQRWMNKWDASLFSWVFVLDDDKFLEALDNIGDILKNEISFARQTNDMFLDERYQLTFHGRTPKAEMFDSEWNLIDEKKYADTLEELKSRVEYLKTKFIADLQSDEEKIFFRKLNISSDGVTCTKEDIAHAKKIIIGIERWLKKNITSGKYKLVIVIESRCNDESFRKLENEHLFIRTVAFFSPFDNTKNGADNYGWKLIMEEFAGNQLKGNEPLGLYELYDRMKGLEEREQQYQCEIKRLQEVLDEKEMWLRELLKSNKWLENQYVNLLKKSDR